MRVGALKQGAGSEAGSFLPGSDQCPFSFFPHPQE